MQRFYLGLLAVLMLACNDGATVKRGACHVITTMCAAASAACATSGAEQPAE